MCVHTDLGLLMCAESEAQKGEADTLAANVRQQWSQEDRERAKQIDGIMHSVITMVYLSRSRIVHTMKVSKPLHRHPQCKSAQNTFKSWEFTICSNLRRSISPIYSHLYTLHV